MRKLQPYKYLVIIAAIPVLSAYANGSGLANRKAVQIPSAVQELAQLESRVGGRLGIAAIDTANHKIIEYRGNERFPFCSTGKVMVCSAILNKSIKNPSLLKKIVKYEQKDIEKSGYAPVTENNLERGMNVGELCAAALDYSDNTAMNLLIGQAGGIQAVNDYARSIKDNTFHLNRMEPDLNTAIPGDLRDTTTPLAMISSLEQLVVGNALPLVQRKQLQYWLKENTTGNNRIRASVSKEWQVGDKTGTGAYGTTNDVGVIWPEGCPPIILAVYYTQVDKDARPQELVVAAASKIILDEFKRTGKCLKSKI